MLCKKPFCIIEHYKTKKGVEASQYLVVGDGVKEHFSDNMPNKKEHEFTGKHTGPKGGMWVAKKDLDANKLKGLIVKAANVKKSDVSIINKEFEHSQYMELLGVEETKIVKKKLPKDDEVSKGKITKPKEGKKKVEKKASASSDDKKVTKSIKEIKEAIDSIGGNIDFLIDHFNVE